MFFKKDFYEILSNIKAYQSERTSQHSPSINSPLWIFDMLHFKMWKWKENELTSHYEIYPPPPPIPEIKNILTSPKNLKFRNPKSPLTLAGGVYLICF